MLNEIKKHFGGNLYTRSHGPSRDLLQADRGRGQNGLQSVYYNSTSFTVFRIFIQYLDKFCLCSNKYKEYVIWRRAYFYRTKISKITKMKETLTRLKR